MNPRNKLRYLSFIVFNLLLLPFLLSFVYAADVKAPSQDNIFYLTVKNIGATDMDGTNVTVTVADDTMNLITIKEIIPTNALISSHNNSQEFQIKFDVAAPNPEEISSPTVKVKFNFRIDTATQGFFYQNGWGYQ